MTKELLILRHGKSDWSIDASDFDRPLKKRGRKAALKIGGWMLQHRLIPDFVISSPAARAISTAEIVCNAIGLDAALIHLDEDIYEAGLEDLLYVLKHLPAEAGRVLLVGHNPGLEDLLEYLVGNIARDEDGKILVTAALAHIEVDKDWAQLEKGGADLISVTRPASLLENY